LTLIYFASGNLAPLSEIIVGVILEKRLGLLRYIPLLFVAFTLNVFICIKAFIEILVWKMRGKACLKWDKTVHKG
jgi:hypothetical protein